MSALLKSPGFFDFLRPLLPQIAPLIPGPWGTIARGAASVVGGAALGTVVTDVVQDLLIQRPTESVSSTAAQPGTMFSGDDEEEVTDEEEAPLEE